MDRVDVEELQHDRELAKRLEEQERYVEENCRAIYSDLIDLKEVDGRVLVDELEDQMDFKEVLSAMIGGKLEDMLGRRHAGVGQRH